jgi:hypothetical protein
MIFLGTGFVFVRRPAGWIAIISLLFCWSIEMSQLYHAPWIDDLRHTRFGGLVLGYEFLWSDMVCYSVGVLIGWLGEKCLIRWL